MAKMDKVATKNSGSHSGVSDKKGERHAFTSRLMKKCPQLWMSLRLISQNSLIEFLEHFFLEKRWVKYS